MHRVDLIEYFLSPITPKHCLHVLHILLYKNVASPDNIQTVLLLRFEVESRVIDSKNEDIRAIIRSPLVKDQSIARVVGVLIEYVHFGFDVISVVVFDEAETLHILL